MNISLIGLPGSGKTTIAKQLSTELGYHYFDSDEELFLKVQKDYHDIGNTQEIYEKFGIDYFREKESEVFKDINTLDKTIISTGGGAILHELTRKIIQENSKIVYVDTPLDILIERIKKQPPRPLFQKDGIPNTLKRLKSEREDLYTEIADLVIDGGLSPTEIVKKIIVALKI